MQWTDFLKPGIDILQFLALLLLWLRKPGEDAKEQIVGVKKDIADAASRIAVVEERMKHMPTSEEMAELKGTVMAVEATLQGVEKSVNTVGVQVARLSDFLMKNKG